MKKILGIVAVIAMLLQGCASYKAAALPSNDVSTFRNRQEQNDVKVGVKFFDSSESKRIFGVSEVYNNYQPAYIVIDNKSKSSYDFSKQMLNQSIQPADTVAEECGFSTVGRATAYGVAGLFFWPLLIPAVVDGVGSSKANKQMKNDFSYKEIQDGVIQPNGMTSGIIFLNKMKNGENLTIKLRDVDNNDVVPFSFTR